MTTLYMKHQMSELADLLIHYEIDEDKHVVTISVDHFDSDLIADFVCIVLERDCGVVAYRDDANKDANWRTPLPPYSLLINLGRTLYQTSVVKLFAVSDKAQVTAVTLEKMRT